MKKERKDKHFIKKPIYEGGLTAMREFISKHKQHPKEALENKVEGTVSLRYEINYKGVVTRVKVISGLGYGCDEEAIRVIKLLKFKVPKNRAGKIKFFKNIQIHFRFPKEKSQPQPSTQINYNVVSSKPKTPQEPVSKKDKGNGYTITINY